ncbi:MAG: hypothetical protein U1E62_26605 [Alsobacter sp.]
MVDNYILDAVDIWKGTVPPSRAIGDALVCLRLKSPRHSDAARVLRGRLKKAVEREIGRIVSEARGVLRRHDELQAYKVKTGRAPAPKAEPPAIPLTIDERRRILSISDTRKG